MEDSMSFSGELFDDVWRRLDHLADVQSKILDQLGNHRRLLDDRHPEHPARTAGDPTRVTRTRRFGSSVPARTHARRRVRAARRRGIYRHAARTPRAMTYRTRS